MRLIALTAVVMLAFAANSLLNRLAVGTEQIGALDFAVLRAIAGAVMLGFLVAVQQRAAPMMTRRQIIGAGSLALYLVGFSIAYVQIDAGIGALLLFGGVQVTMFAGGLIGGDRPPTRRWIGASMALSGLAWLVWPSGSIALPPVAVIAMLLAAFGWGIYSLAGRGSGNPLAETAGNFLFAVPLCALPLLVMPVAAEGPVPVTLTGGVLAVLAGAVTSGLGYALWYAVLPRLGASTSGLVQLSVPVIAALGGIVLLGESASWRMLGAGALTLGGIAYGLGAFQRRIGSSGS